MKQPERILASLEPPPGGWERLRARRDSAGRWAPSWWALASGCAAVLAWLAVATGPTALRMQFAGERLVGERSRGVELEILGNGHPVALPTADPNVHIYLVTLSNSPAEGKQ